jgi:aminomethyltransferase
MKTTVLHKNHQALNARMTLYAGFDMPLSYQGISEEHLAVRTNMGIFDVSHMGEFLIDGIDAIKFTNYLVTNLILEDYQKVTYSLMLDHQGFVVDDLLVYVIKSNQVLLVVNAANIEKDLEWIQNQIKDYDCQIRNVSDEYSQIAIQGPNVIENIEKIVLNKGDDLSFMTYKVIPYLDGYVILSRTGYTGEDGFEIYGTHELVKSIFEKAIESGVTPCGLGARDTLRFEANLPLYGHEISESINPVEAGLNFALKFEKDFIGKDALVKYKENIKRKVVGIELLEKNIPRHGYKVFDENDVEIGFVTTGYLLPNQEKPIALALVDSQYQALGTKIFVEIRNKKIAANVRNKKFYIKNYKK